MEYSLGGKYMIIYFSATGNNQYIATQISQQLNDTKISMIQLTKDNNYEIKLEDEEKLGIIIPTYFIGIPTYVEEYLSKIKISIAKNNYVYIISSYGTSPGYSTGYVKEYLKEQNIKTDAEYAIKMPDTWTVWFDVSNKEKIKKQNEEVEEQLKKIILDIKDHKKGKFVKRSVPKIFANFAQIMYDNQRKTNHLRVLDSCNQCGLCETSCPINAIELIDNHVEWVTERCVMCLRCLHRCPQFAIQYDNKTQKHGQYTNSHIKIFD